jgi:ketol-acid reductoisomerase
VREDGSWDYDLLSSHRALIDNIDKIVKSVYTQGLGDGQKTIVNTAANVSTQTAPTTNQNQQSDPLAAQLKNIMSGTSGKMTFNI